MILPSAGSTWSQLSRTMSTWRTARWSATATSTVRSWSTRPSAVAIARATASASSTTDRSTNQAPSGMSGSTDRVTSRASVVLPVPAAPVSVTTRRPRGGGARAPPRSLPGGRSTDCAWPVGWTAKPQSPGLVLLMREPAVWPIESAGPACRTSAGLGRPLAPTGEIAPADRRGLRPAIASTSPTRTSSPALSRRASRRSSRSIARSSG